MTTPCTICGLPTAGSGDDDTACCAWCEGANLAGAEVRPPGWLRREIPVPSERSAALAFGQVIAQAWRDEEGREA